jgi:glycosyltransferase involved in cell wall biosynthesis
LVEDGKTGYVVPPCDSDAIRDRLEHLAKHPELVESMGRAARQSMLARNGEDWSAYAGILERLVA